jgi:glycosyltransferase involved in cell wall biosynthesis
MHLDPVLDDLMRPTPLFSVFIPVRNDASWLGGAIASILAQTYGDWELIIGDNASTDDVRSVVAVDDGRVRYHRWDESVDVIASWNRTASLCRGTWMVPIGADDRLLPDALETFATAIRDRPDLVMVVAACIRLDQDGRPAAATWRFYQGLARVRPGDYDARSWIQAVAAPGQPRWNIGSVALNRSAVERLGGYFNPEAGAAADIEVVLRMAIGGPVRYLDKRVMIFTQRLDSDYRAQHRSARTDDQEETFLGRGLRIGLAAHEGSRGPLSARERGWVYASIARSFMQRAAEHRALRGGQGRRGAWRDIVRAWRARPSTVLSPRGLIVVIGVLLFPDWVLEAANRLLRVSSS